MPERSLSGPAWAENPFEAVCAMASRERWCWKIGCGTCGAMHFRYALRELTLGRTPGTREWRTSKRRHRTLGDEVGQMAGNAPWGEREQSALVRMLAEARPRVIVESSRYPDGLGYLGLALYFVAKAEACDRSLTRAWVPGLASLLTDASDERAQRSVLQMQERDVLTPGVMERIEFSMPSRNTDESADSVRRVRRQSVADVLV